MEQKNSNLLSSLSNLEVLQQQQEGSHLTVGSGDCSVAKMLSRSTKQSMKLHSRNKGDCEKAVGDVCDSRTVVATPLEEIL